MAETVEYQKPTAEHVTSRHIFFIYVFEANTKMVFLKERCFLQ